MKYSLPENNESKRMYNHKIFWVKSYIITIYQFNPFGFLRNLQISIVSHKKIDIPNMIIVYDNHHVLNIQKYF